MLQVTVVECCIFKTEVLTSPALIMTSFKKENGVLAPTANIS
jgi:hypothetical protein